NRTCSLLWSPNSNNPIGGIGTARKPGPKGAQSAAASQIFRNSPRADRGSSWASAESTLPTPTTTMDAHNTGTINGPRAPNRIRHSIKRYVAVAKNTLARTAKRREPEDEFGRRTLRKLIKGQCHRYSG